MTLKIKNTNTISVMLLTLAVVLASCKNDDPAPSKRPFLVGKTWIVVQYALNGEDQTEDRDECEFDNTTAFFNDGTYREDIGDIACEESENNVEGTWSFKANETIISFRPANENASDWKIEELSDDFLKISQYVPTVKAEVLIVMAPL
ncbi:lipocalin-like domain-containing protein [Pseudochryseolinea flava]|uniref:Lipocalin-like domain-containing protein n=1 Tax=Pseudochryseolinea flava TaxID=2059302 RepID=A0A364Y621_9BACT|nr:lipocalin family protein [Pseudochryseolinea flava]RAW02245.1 hypothetical protein DQQ10_06800 [Pseudochryseolinea flava]